MAVQTGIVSHIQLNLALACEEAAALPSQGFLPLTCLLGNSWGTEHTLPTTVASGYVQGPLTVL